jgi:UDP:flavonoid glycosyltransferase YjiC (YdhE family)
VVPSYGMRVLLTSRGSSGHIGPLAPFADAARDAGHDVLAAVSEPNAANARHLGLPVATFDAVPPEIWRPRLAEMMEASFEEANRAMIAEYFGRLDTQAALPGLREIVATWRPDVIVRESWEFASTLAGELHGVPVVRVGLAIGSVEAIGDELVAPVLDELRAEHGLPPDPCGRALRRTPYLTMVPEELEGAGAPAPERTHRFGRPVTRAAAADPPLVYASFGSITGGEGMPYFPALYRAAIDALAPVGADVLLTLGNDRDVADLGPLPGNVRVERWVPQEEVLSRAAAVVTHGGYGAMLGALAHGVPCVVLPLFSFDQWRNAAALARAGAGIALDGHSADHGLMSLPPAEAIEALGPAVARVLADGAHRGAARRLAGAMAALPPPEAAVGVLEAAAQTAAV